MNKVLGFTPLVLDFETFFDTKNGYTLSSKQSSMVEYVRDARFRVHGFGMSMNGEAPRWVGAADAEAVLRSLPWAEIALIGHNLKFDASILFHHYHVSPALRIDTMGMSHAVNGAALPRHSLGALAEAYGLQAKGTMLTDGVQTLTDWQEKELAEYCLNDVTLTAELFERLRGDFPENQYPVLDWTIKCFTEPQLEIDVALMEKASTDEAARREAFFVSPLALEATAAVQPEPTLTKAGKPRKQKEVEPKKAFASNDLFPKVLEHFGYEVPMKQSPTAAKQGEEKLIPALALGDPEFVDMVESEDLRLRQLCEARVAAKSTIFETRSAKLAKVGKTGLWPFDVQFSGAKQTHRLSGGPGAGGNPQNLPAHEETAAVMRQAIRAPAGQSLVVGDFANIELRVLAWLAQDRVLMDAIKAGRDLYCDFGSMHYGRTITKENKAERFFSKCAVLGLGYNMGVEKFIKVVKIQTGQEITKEEAESAVNLYRTTYGAVPALWAYLGNLLPLMAEGQSGTLHTLPAVKWDAEGFILPSGLRIYYPELRITDPEAKRKEWVYTAFRSKRKDPDTVKIYGGKMTENIVQALAGEICKHAIRLLDYAPCGQVHDELLWVMPESHVDHNKNAMYAAMTTPPPWLRDIKLDAEIGVGQTWKEAK